MRGKKSYNIRNIEAHINNFSQPLPVMNNPHPPTSSSNSTSTFLLNKNMVFQNNAQNILINTSDQNHNEYINAKYGVSKYASNLVSGKMFKKI
jgi:hypothetical protein